MIFNFSVVQVHFVFLLIEFHCTFSMSYKILQYFVYYYCIFKASLLAVFVCLSYYIFAASMSKCLGKHSFMSPPFPIAILNGAFFFS